MWYFAQMMMYLDTSQKSPIRYDMIQALRNVSRFDTDPQKVYLDTRYVSNIAILCTTGDHNTVLAKYSPNLLFSDFGDHL